MFHWFKKHNREGLETPDETPIEITLRTKPLTITEQIQRFTQNEEIRERLRNNGIDTFDEADDFDVQDMENEERFAPYESQFHGKMMPEGLQARLDEQKAGMTEEMPIERQERAKGRFLSKDQALEKSKAADAAAQQPKAEIKKVLDA